MPTSAMNTYSMQELVPAMPAHKPVPFSVTFAASQTIARGTVLGQITTGGKFTIYDPNASDGSQVARAIAKYDMITDSNGKVIFSSSGAAANEQGQLYPSAEVYISGAFNCADLNVGGVAGITSAALGDLQGRVFYGSLTTGVMIF